MLQAVISGKAANIIVEGEKKSWRELFRTREDLITASIFGRLPYLSDALIKSIMNNLLGITEISPSQDIGEFRSINFWPRYQQDGSQCSYIEPDLLIEFSQATILVEVKPPWSAQGIDQWKREIFAFIGKDQDLDTPLYLLALGGEVPTWKQDAAHLENQFKHIRLRVSTCTWQQLNHCLYQLSDQSEGRDSRILEDQLHALTLHGIRRPLKPIGDLKGKSGVFDLNLLKSWLDETPQPEVTENTWESLNTIAFQIRRDLKQWH